MQLLHFTFPTFLCLKYINLSLPYSPTQVIISPSFLVNQPLHLNSLNSCPTEGSYLFFGPCYILLFIVFLFIFTNLLERITVCLTYKIISTWTMPYYSYFVLKITQLVQNTHIQILKKCVHFRIS